jgi:hypothetical protein
MGRLTLTILAAILVVEAAQAQETSPGAKNARAAEAAVANAHCAALGEGFFAVAGSSTCIRISGHVSAGVGFATSSVNGHAFAAPVTGSAVEEGVAGDVRFDTPMGPGRVYVNVGNVNGSRWVIDGQ